MCQALEAANGKNKQLHVLNHVVTSVGEIELVRMLSDAKNAGRRGKKWAKEARDEWVQKRKVAIEKARGTNGSLEGVQTGGELSAEAEWKQWLRKANQLEIAYSKVSGGVRLVRHS